MRTSQPHSDNILLTYWIPRRPGYEFLAKGYAKVCVHDKQASKFRQITTVLNPLNVLKGNQLTELEFRRRSFAFVIAVTITGSPKAKTVVLPNAGL